MRSIVSVVLLSAVALFAQSDRGTITGTISDPAGAVVANAAIEAKGIKVSVIDGRVVLEGRVHDLRERDAAGWCCPVAVAVQI